MKVTPSMAHHASVLTAISATVIGSALWFAPGANAEIQVVSAWRAEGATALVGVDLPAPAKNDAASQARLRISGGVVDSNSGGISKLRDGKLPTEADQPDENFFFAAGTTGGRLSLDLERVVEVQQINTYSRHPDTRGPQVYKLFASAGTEPGFVERLEKSADPSANGWKLIATVDTRAKSGPGGGEHRVSISDSEGMLGRFRYLLFEISRTEADDDFGNTFYSEIDVIENGAAAESVANAPYVFKTADGSCEFTIDTGEAADLRDWAVEKLAPTLAEWYPKIVALLPSEDYTAPKAVTISIRPINGVAFASGPRITANSDWLRRELKGEAIGALVHEAVHVVQQYGGGRRNRSTEYKHPPGWLGEGIPDYIRFFLYEPQSHGADLLWLQGRRNQALNYDGMYRITANFLNFVVEKYDAKREFITKINAACRQGKYADELWLELTGKSLASLNDEWKAATKLQLETKAASGLNTLTEAEKSAGWRLLFNGVDFAGWHNFKRDGVRPGWQVKDGALVCVDPHDAGDLVTTDKFAAFELQLEYNISEGGNSGIMYHVTDEGGAAWATGPEFQLEDNAKAKDPQRCGWLYALYQPENDPQTGQPLDATKPAGEWNHVRLVISPDKCEHWINGVKYFEYVKGSDDFKARIAESKFSKMPLFAKADSGSLALQGDHGQISFRNIKVRSLRTRVTEARASNQ